MKLAKAPKTKEPPNEASLVLIGKNSRGHWVAQAQNGLYGGLFVDRLAAMRYALFENGRHPEFIVAVSTVVELDMESAGTFRSKQQSF